MALIYTLALHLGGGYAMPPMPTDGKDHPGHAANTPTAQMPTVRSASRQADHDKVAATRDVATVSFPTRQHTVDVAPPWVLGSDGKTHFVHD